MYLWGKILGFIFGYLIAGFWGAILGCWAGHQFDIALAKMAIDKVFSDSEANYEYPTQRVFFEAVFSVMGCLAKADGRVSEQAIYNARQIMQQMGLSARQKREAIILFTQGKQLNFDLDKILLKLLRAGQHQPSLLQNFLELQLKVIYNTDHYVSHNKQQILDYIARRLGFMLFNNAYNQYTYAGEQTSQQRNASANKTEHLASAYEMLGLTNNASNQEVKVAYRRLMSRYHPDKVTARGEAGLLKKATEKTQQIKEAYEQIKEARGMV
ncbi:MAG: mucZ [Gammaproteobacteria bacterium]|jgi:DnaJ like chaperone protein|nr:mucZ [Gammaproteobacteria bacterium]